MKKLLLVLTLLLTAVVSVQAQYIGITPTATWRQTNAALDTKVWLQRASSATFQRCVENDAMVTITCFETVTRSGLTVTDIQIQATNFKQGGNVGSMTTTVGTGGTTSFVTLSNPTATGSQGYQYRVSGTYLGAAGTMSKGWMNDTDVHVAINQIGALVYQSGEFATAASGTHPLLAVTYLDNVSGYVSGGAAVTDSAMLYVAGTLSSVTPTGNNYAIWDSAGPSRFDGKMAFGVVPNGDFVVDLGTTATLTSSSNVGVGGLRVSPVIASGNGGYPTAARIKGTINTASSGTTTQATGLWLAAPNITINGTNALAEATTLLIDAPSVTGTPTATYTLHVTSGTSFLNGAATFGGAVNWTTGLGAISHFVGPTDQNFTIQSPASRPLVFNTNGATEAARFGIAQDLQLKAKVTVYNNASPADGQLLIGGTAAGNWTAGTLTGIANQTAITNGNNSITIGLTGPYTPATYTSNGVLYGNATSSIGVTAQGAAGTVLHGNAGVPTFTAVSLTADVTGTLPVANGGSGTTATPCSNTAASSAISGTASKTYFSISCKITANTLAAGTTIILHFRGVYSGNATDTLTMTLDACQVSGCGSGTIVNLATTSALTLLALTNQEWEMDEDIIAFTIGGTGTLSTQGHVAYETASTTMAFDATPNTGTATVSTTVDEYLTASVTFSTNSANDSITLRNIIGRIQ